MDNSFTRPELGLPLIPSGWQYASLGDLIQPGGLSYGVVQPGKNDPNGVPIIRVKDLRNGRVTISDVSRVSGEIEAKYRRTRLQGGEILLSLVGTVGEVAVAPSHVAGWNTARAIAVIRPLSSVASEWIKVCLSASMAQHYMRIWQTNTVQATLNLRDVRRLPIVMPPAPERVAISALLGALDDKIAVNERIAESSRSLALTLFVDGVASSEARVVPIVEISKLLTRGTTPRYTEDNHQMMVINQKCIRGGRVDLSPARRTLSDKVRADRVLRDGDILVNSTGVGTLGRVALWRHGDEATCDTHVTIVRVDEKIVPRMVGGFAVLSAQSEIEQLGEGSTGQTELSRTKLGKLLVSLPTESACVRLEADLRSLETVGERAISENRTLAALRDTLLPRLISGELRIKEAELQVENAV